MKINKLIFGLIGMLFFIACDPQQDDKIELPPAPTSADFTISDGPNPNTYILKNTTSGGFLFAWDFGNGTTANGEEVQAFYPEKGDYEVTMMVFTAGGSASSSKILNVPEDAPFQCEGNPLYEFLSDCTERSWKLNPDDGAFWVGPADGSGTTWWSNTTDDVAERFCAFDDTWTFTGEGEMIYNTNGDVWGEDYMGFNFECVDESQLQPPVDAWGSGNHTYTLVNGSPHQLIVSGLGAFMGLPKAANGAEVTIPQAGVTYDILRMDDNSDHRILEIEVNYSAGIWRFTFRSDN